MHAIHFLSSPLEMELRAWTLPARPTTGKIVYPILTSLQVNIYMEASKNWLNFSSNFMQLYE